MDTNVNNEYMDIAIIGMAGRFPGAESVSEFWNNLLEGRDCITHGTNAETKSSTGYEIVNSYGKIEGMYEFDNEFFGINKKEAIELDPQERKVLEVSYEAIEDAGINIDKYQGRIGIICGTNENEYSLKKYYEQVNNNIMGQTSKMYLGSSIASRTAYKLNLTGPCMTIKATCATALAAVHTASQMLLNYESDVMIAGSVNLSLNTDSYAYLEGGITSKDGIMRAFSKKAGGCVPGDGIGMIVLKRLSDAVKDNDNIVAVIKGSALCNDGNRKIGFTAPSIEGEYETIMTALGVSGLKDDEIDYIESHGTGTELGDMVEIKALNKVFSSAEKNSIGLGAVKNNVGHLNYAAGCAGLIKAAMVVNKRLIPPVINVEDIKDELNDTPFYINKELVKISKKGPMRAGVSGFGIGGVDSHIILEEYVNEKYDKVDINKPVLLVISAKTKISLEKYKNKILEFSEKNHYDLNNIAFTLQTGRKQYEYSSSIIVHYKDGKLEILYEKDNHIEEEIFERNSKKKINIDEYKGEYIEKEYVDYLLRYSEAFLQGYDICWGNLYVSNSAGKISLPKYCFEKNIFNYFSSCENVNNLEITEDDVSAIKRFEIEQEKVENMLTEEDFKGISNYYEKVSLYAAADYLKRQELNYYKTYTFEEIIKDLKVIPKYKHFAEYFIMILNHNNLAEVKGNSIKISPKIIEMNVEEIIKEGKKLYPQFAMKLDFILQCINQYDVVFKGMKEGNSVLYPEGRYDTILKIGENTPDISREPIYINSFPKIIRYFINKMKGSSTVRILELGSGTGIITWPLLEELKDLNVEYYFTDFGKSFIALAKEKVRKMNYKNVVFKQYNIEKNYAEQGFEGETFDFVISMNVMQVSHNFNDAVKNVSGLLKKNGIFACVQAFVSDNINYLTYGYAPGWWNYEEDPLRKGKNIMLPHYEWKNMLNKLGFKNINIIYDSLNGKNDKFGFIFANRPDNIELFDAVPVNYQIKENNNKETDNGDIMLKEIIQMVEDAVGEELTGESSLFDIGFDSLSLLILSSQIKEKFNVDISVKKLYEFNTVYELCSYIKDYLKRYAGDNTDKAMKEESNNSPEKDINNLFNELEVL